MTETSDAFLEPARVREIYEQCYRDPTSRTLHRTEVEAWLLRHTFSVMHLTKRREDIVKLLLCLPDGFRVDERGGGSVAQMVCRQDGVVWTGEMPDVEKLLALGLAIGLVEFCAPREVWSRLPGGFPYVRILVTRFGVSVN